MKQLLGAVLLCIVLFCAACSGRTAKTGADLTPPPTSTTSRSEPVHVDEIYANTDVVTDTTPATPAPTPSANAAPVTTPATGDFPIVSLAGAIALILFCSAGLVMLRRI